MAEYINEARTRKCKYSSTIAFPRHLIKHLHLQETVLMMLKVNMGEIRTKGKLQNNCKWRIGGELSMVLKIHWIVDFITSMSRRLFCNGYHDKNQCPMTLIILQARKKISKAKTLTSYQNLMTLKKMLRCFFPASPNFLFHLSKEITCHLTLTPTGYLIQLKTVQSNPMENRSFISRQFTKMLHSSVHGPDLNRYSS